MEYLVLARKFRPQSFEDVAGQEHVVKTLRNAISQGRVAHAFLFSGPRGVGKTSVARILAKSLNCEKGPIAIPCNVCSNCREITDGRSLDVREIDGASNRGIDEIRELRENVKFAPAAAKYKIYIIDEVHMLTREAFNALLKTLEEPPSHVIFIFATTESHKVPATILSRCQCYDFRRISLKEIMTNLQGVATAEEIKISPAALSWIAEAGDGSMRDAQSIFDQVISYAGMNIKDADVEENLGLTDRKYLFDLSAAIIKRDAGACLTILEEAYLAGIDMKHFYQMLIKHFRNLLLVKIAGEGSSSFDIAPEQIEKLKKQINNITRNLKVTRETLQRFVEILIAEGDRFRRSQEARTKLETIIVKMAYLEPIIPLGEIVSTIEAIEQKLQKGLSSTDNNKEPGVSTNNTATETNVNSSEENSAGDSIIANNIDTSNLATIRDDFKNFIKKENAILGAKTDSAEILNYSGGCLTLGFPKSFIFLEDIKGKKQKEQLEQIAQKFFRENVEVKITTIEIEKVNTNGNNGRSKTNTLNDIKREAINHPLLQKVMNEFTGAEVIEIKARTDKSR
ncbi:MAG: DNA polymerase III, subunit gamma and tau [Deltaproteobacteria bacterium RBG_19FT_COMBO_43_11]|nr:MAG: DNA polymerase III, subunit gamma and tau [Deltaproteobacteria bacterium RBG_19FT_COMBO_43_11]